MALGVPVLYVTATDPRRRMQALSRNELRQPRQVESGSLFLQSFMDQSTTARTLGCSTGNVIDNTLHQIARQQTKKMSHGDRRVATGGQLLSLFKDLILSDEVQLNFNYLAFWLNCAELIEQLKISVWPKLPQAYKETHLGPTGDSKVVSALFLEYGKALEFGREPSTTQMPLAAKILQNFIAKHGETLITVARDQSSEYFASGTDREQ